jgi:hypothetical protein
MKTFNHSVSLGVAVGGLGNYLLPSQRPDTSDRDSIVSVRAYGAQEAFINQSFSRLDNYSRAIRPYENLLNWVSTRLDILGGCFEASLAAYMVYFSSSGAAETGFCLAQAGGWRRALLMHWIDDLFTSCV